MIGRIVERRSIDKGYVAAARGEPTVLTLVGEAGTGKTELVRYAAESARSRRPAFRVVTVRAYEFDATLPMTALSGVVAALRDTLGALAPTQQRALDAVVGGAAHESSDVFGLAAALVNLLAAAADRPLFVAFDDIHWLDPFSAHVIGLALRRLQAEPILVALAGRFVPDALRGTGSQLEIAGLSAADCVQLLHDIAPYPASRGVAAELARRTQGNPLMLDEVARLLAPAQLAGTARLPDPLPIGGTGKAIVAPIIAPLPTRTRRALAVVALAGQASQLAVPMALPLLGLRLADLDPAIIARIVLRDGWRFRHPLFGAEVIDETEPAEVRRIHAALAAVLERTDVTRHAHHLAEAAGGVDEAAASALQDAAQLAVRRGGVASAAQLWHRAAELSPPGPSRTSRLLEAVEAQAAAGQRDLARAGLDELAGSALTVHQLTRATRARAMLLPWSSTVAHDVLQLEAASVTIGMSDPLVAAEICTNLVLAGFSVGAADLVLRQIERATEYAAGHPILLMVAQLMGSVALSLFRGVPWEPEITRLADPTVRSYIAANLPQTGAGIAQALIWVDQPELSMRLRSDVVEGARDAGALAVLPYPLTGAGELAWWTGAWDAGRRDIAEAIELAGLVGQESLLGYAWSLLANFAAAAGRHDELEAALARAEEAASASGTGPVRIYIARARLHSALAANRVADAVGHGADAHAIARDVGLAGLMQVPYLPEYVEAALLAGRADATALLSELRDRTDTKQSDWGRSIVARSEAIASDDPDEARMLFMTALEQVPSQRMPFEHARTLHRHGERELAEGRYPAARQALGNAMELFDQLGALAWRDQAAAALRRAGGRAAPRMRRANPLSAQQERVVDLVARGATNREAAARLFLSEKTIEYHVSAAMRALGATNRTDLARRYRTDERRGDNARPAPS